jgi:hypothetical protein
VWSNFTTDFEKTEVRDKGKGVESEQNPGDKVEKQDAGNEVS